MLLAGASKAAAGGCRGCREGAGLKPAGRERGAPGSDLGQLSASFLPGFLRSNTIYSLVGLLLLFQGDWLQIKKGKKENPKAEVFPFIENHLHPITPCVTGPQSQGVSPRYAIALLQRILTPGGKSRLFQVNSPVTSQPAF